MKRFRFRPTYSNLVATSALFFALAGGAWAATQLPKESVGSPQLKNGAVTPAKLSGAAKKGMTGQAGPQGALGPRGNEGPRGEGGPIGATGPQGVRGATGATGATGPRGEVGEIGLRGPEGQTGAAGEKGDTGATGARGERGEPGPKGEEGPAGAKGEPGEAGATGEPGPKGEPGEKGEPGPKGEPGEKGEPGPSDAYVDVSEPHAVEITNAPAVPNIPLEVQNLPAGEYVVQAVLTVRGTALPVRAECEFWGDGAAITLGPSGPFLTDVAGGEYASLVGTTTAVVTVQSTLYVTCEAASAGTSFSIPAESGYLTVTKVGALHTTVQ